MNKLKFNWNTNIFNSYLNPYFSCISVEFYFLKHKQYHHTICVSHLKYIQYCQCQTVIIIGR